MTCTGTILRCCHKIGALISAGCLQCRGFGSMTGPLKRHTSTLKLIQHHRKHLNQCLTLCTEVCHNRNTSVASLMKSWIQVLSERDIPEPQTSAELIVAHAFGKKMIHQVDVNRDIPANILENINEMCKQRLTRIPVQYIIREWDFHDMTLEMCPPVLIPRPETEELADMIVNSWLEEFPENGTFLEIGCGTGAISLYILHQLPKVRCVAVDINKSACELTVRNAARYNLNDRLHVIHGDIQDNAVKQSICEHGPFNLLVSNPPYLTSEEMKSLEAEVSEFEDHGSLYGGTDGLDLIRHILSLAHNVLHPQRSTVWLEVGLGHPELIREIVQSNEDYMLTYEQSLKDFTQRERFCKLRFKR